MVKLKNCKGYFCISLSQIYAGLSFLVMKINGITSVYRKMNQSDDSLKFLHFNQSIEIRWNSAELVKVAKSDCVQLMIWGSLRNVLSTSNITFRNSILKFFGTRRRRSHPISSDKNKHWSHCNWSLCWRCNPWILFYFDIWRSG